MEERFKINFGSEIKSRINTGLVDENEFNVEVDEFEEYDVASSLLEKEEEEESHRALNSPSN